MSCSAGAVPYPDIGEQWASLCCGLGSLVMLRSGDLSLSEKMNERKERK